MTVHWNLVDSLSPLNGRRMFYPPLSALPPGGPEDLRQAEAGQFSVSDEWDHLTRPTRLTFKIRIQPLDGAGFAADGDLPDPAIRLHAVGAGMVRFHPASQVEGQPARLARLELEMVDFAQPIQVPWWQRWVDAQLCPRRLIYENVDIDIMEGLLASLQPVSQVDLEGQPIVPEHYGLRLPREITSPEAKQEFIDAFLAGNLACMLEASAGAFIGAAAPVPDPVEDVSPPREIRLQAYYWPVPQGQEPPPMNPRELFHLLFGDSSEEALGHPLLRAIDDRGRLQTDRLETRTMRLRPPLRTSARVFWEAQWEIENDQERHENGEVRRWAPLRTENRGKPNEVQESPGPDGQGSRIRPRLFNQYDQLFSARMHRYNSGDYFSRDKCNIFVSDICLRAGFRVLVVRQLTPTYHYALAKQITDRAHFASTRRGGNGQPIQRAPIMGAGTHSDRILGWGLYYWLRQFAGERREEEVNHAIEVEGRCIVLAGARGRNRDNTRYRAGHVVLVKEILDEPKLLDVAEEGLHSCAATILEASGEPTPNSPQVDLPGARKRPGAVERQRTFVLGTSPHVVGTRCQDHVRVQLLEVHPGGDPDTAAGLEDLHVWHP
jgi:hypothetical protein